MAGDSCQRRPLIGLRSHKQKKFKTLYDLQVLLGFRQNSLTQRNAVVPKSTARAKNGA